MNVNSPTLTRLELIAQLLRGTALRPDVIDTLFDTAEANFEAAALMCDTFFSSESQTARVIQILPAVVAYAMAGPWVKDADKRERFLNDTFFNDRTYRLSDAKLLSYAIMFVRKGHRGSIAQRARREAGAMQDNFDNEVPVAEVFRQLIEEGGFDGMLERLVAARGDTAPMTIDDRSEANQADNYDGFDEDVPHDAQGCAMIEHEDEVGTANSARCPLDIPPHLRSRCAAMRLNDERDVRVKKVRDHHGSFGFQLIEI